MSCKRQRAMMVLHAIRRFGAFVGGAATLAAAVNAWGVAGIDAALPAYQPERAAVGDLSSIGDDAMKPLMNAWMQAFRKRQPVMQQGARWEHAGPATAFGALMFEAADLAPLARAPWASELAPYAHQFAGDMMKSPLLVRVAGTAEHPAYVAVNKRPGSPLPPKISEFLAFALSAEGQQIVAADGKFVPLAARDAAQQRALLQGFVAVLDPALKSYEPAMPVNGVIKSVGSDGMKTLMDRWMRDFRALQPGVRKGERWEHLGTLNGFHALLAKETDLAPMGRELWPDEQRVYEATLAQRPFELRVARGGFNTPQRTTAQAIFVNERNPIARITLPQLAAIFGDAETITRWGQLGLTGEWADLPVTIHVPPLVAPNAVAMQMMLLQGGAWSSALREASLADTAQAIASDPGAIGFGGFEEGGPGLKTLAVAARDGSPFYEGSAENASTGRYPLTRYMYIRINRGPGEVLPPAVKEFLRFVLSRQGQEPILYSGYFPLSAREVEEELAKLD